MEKRKAKDIRIKVRANKIIEELEINLRKRKIEIKDQDRMIRSMIKKKTKKIKKKPRKDREKNKEINNMKNR